MWEKSSECGGNRLGKVSESLLQCTRLKDKLSQPHLGSFLPNLHPELCKGQT